MNRFDSRDLKYLIEDLRSMAREQFNPYDEDDIDRFWEFFVENKSAIADAADTLEAAIIYRELHR